MLRGVLFVTPFLLFGCASVRSNPVSVGDSASISDTETPRVEALAAPDAPTAVLPDLALEPQAPPASPPPRPRQRFTLKGGYYGSTEDGIDDGYIINASWITPTSGAFATEFEVGYLDASGSDNGVDRDVWGIPLMMNGRLSVPVGEKIELYGGLGFGTFYFDGEAKAAGVTVNADGWLFAGDAFFGGALLLGESLSVGLEGKYYLTEEASDLGGGLDAYVVMLTLGFGR